MPGFNYASDHARSARIEAFPFTRFGNLSGRLALIGRDAIQDNMIGLVYQIGVLASLLSNQRQRVIGVRVGSYATAGIGTDERRDIYCLLSPIKRCFANAGRQR